MNHEQESTVTKSTRPSSKPSSTRLRPSQPAATSSMSLSRKFFQKYTLFLLTPCLLAIWKLCSIDLNVFITHSTIEDTHFFLPSNNNMTMSSTRKTRSRHDATNNNTAHHTVNTTTAVIPAKALNVTSSSNNRNVTKQVHHTDETTAISGAPTTGHVAWDTAFYQRWKTAQSLIVNNNNSNIDDYNDEWYLKRTANATAVIAYATTITSCQDNNKGSQYMDMAAVLAHSIHLSSIRNPNSTSMYDYQLYAFIHPDAIVASNSTWCADQMQALGYIIQIRDTPINITLIQRQSYVDRLIHPNSGCCGAKEFLKLYSYTLTQHPIVVHVDLDVMILKPLDDFFHVMLNLPADDSSVDDRYMEHAMWPEDRHLMATTTTRTNTNTTIHENNNNNRKRVISAMFTRDYPMLPIKDGNTEKHVKVGVQGGFLMIRPNVTIFNELCQLVLQGNFDSGWYEPLDPTRPEEKKKKVHYPGFYGAAQVQGLLAFYYGHVNPNQTIELNRCIVNNMVDNPRVDENVCITGQPDDECQDCRLFNISDIYTAHFTFCSKPSYCGLAMTSEQPLCYALHREWHRIRYDLETILNDHDKDSNINKTTPMIMEPAKLRDFYGHCTKGRYATMGWQNLTIILKKLAMEENGNK